MLMPICEFLAAKHAYLDYRLQTALNFEVRTLNFRDYWKSLSQDQKTPYLQKARTLLKTTNIREVVFDSWTNPDS